MPRELIERCVAHTRASSLACTAFSAGSLRYNASTFYEREIRRIVSRNVMLMALLFRRLEHVQMITVNPIAHFMTRRETAVFVRDTLKNKVKNNEDGERDDE